MFVIKYILYCFISQIVPYAVIGHHHHKHNDNFHIIDTQQCSSISTKELRKISMKLFDELPNNIFEDLIINYQEKKYTKDAKDEASKPLFTIPAHLFETLPTLRLLHKLYDNYNMNSSQAENLTPEENSEENAFIDGILNTSTIIQTMNFLANKNCFKPNFNLYKQILKRIWFGLYSRSNKTELGSSGFEHVFMVEKNSKNHIVGLHNWIFFGTEEYNKKANYLGYINKKQLNNKASVLKFYFSYLNKRKLSSMFIGTLPEFEIALYTLCFFAKPNKNCNIQLGNQKITITTWVQSLNNKKFISSSFPKI